MAVSKSSYHHLISALTLMCSLFATTTFAANLPPYVPETYTGPTPHIEDVKIECATGHMVITILQSAIHPELSESTTETGEPDVPPASADLFSGLIYPRGLSRNSSCMAEYIQQPAPVRYTLPLRSCNTMSTDTDDGGVEYFNTIVVQPHLKLVTNQGRGFHVRCKYSSPENSISFNEPLDNGLLSPKRLSSVSELPTASMKIFFGEPNLNHVAENVKIGDPLTLVITLEKQDLFGIKVSDCVVRDGLGWGEQRLINTEGCPVDGEIMGMFDYSDEKTKATVHFQAHKFPYTQSVYYQCNVKLCIKKDGSCNIITPPSCGKNRGRRQAKDSSEGIPATIEVYSGLYVNEATDVAKPSLYDDIFSERNTPEDSICIPQKKFAIGIAIAGIILMLLVVLALIILMTKRRHKKVSSVPGSSIYSGPYTNTAYSHSS